MDNVFHKDRYYRVKEKEDRDGRKAYVVEAAETKLCFLFGIFTIYDKKNSTLDEAIDQIKHLDSIKMVNEKVVYKKEFK